MRSATARTTELLIVLLLTFAAATCRAESARDILDRQQALEKGPRHWDDRSERMRLTVTDRSGAERHLEFTTYDRKDGAQGQKSRIVFSAPAEKAGIELLGVTQHGRVADQWLYAPETHRPRQVAKNARANRFDITDFTYLDLDIIADLPNWTEQDASSTLRGMETVDGVECYVIELSPHLEHVVYERIVLWIGSADLIVRQVEFYRQRDQAGALTRFLNRVLGGGPPEASNNPVRRFRQHDIRTVGAIPVAYRIEVETPDEGTRTTIDVVDVQFNQGLSESFFTSSSLGTSAR